MTSVSSFEDFLDELRTLREMKENPDEWYFVQGTNVGEYSIQAAEKPDDVPDDQSELPPEMQDATENVDGFYQIGTIGWSADAFDAEVDFVSETGFSETFDKIDKRTNGLLFVHESQLSEKAIELANEKQEKEAPADV